MSQEDLELLITMDDPGEDTLEEDTFHLQSDKQRSQKHHPSKPPNSELLTAVFAFVR